MGKNQLEVFCTAGDFGSLVDEVQAHMRIAFAVAGLFETPAVRRLDTPTDLKALISTEGESAFTFLAVRKDDSVGVRKVPQKNGGSRYGVDQISNPKSVVLRPGRMVDQRTLLAGQVGTVSNDPTSVNLFSAFSKVVRRRFVKVKSYWVGPEAVRLLDSGGRLTAALKASPEYDLRR